MTDTTNTHYGNAEPGDTLFVEGLDRHKYDPFLGAQVREHLSALGLETIDPSKYFPEEAYSTLVNHLPHVLTHLGLDINDPSLKGTAVRYAKMLIGELTRGLNYDFFPKCTTVPNGAPIKQGWVSDPESGNRRVSLDHAEWVVEDVKGTYNQMVLVDNIETISLCEHHLQTIDGVTHIGYIPNRLVLGLSKFARVTDFFARRPQIQERMTEQIYAALSYILETKDIAVVIRATHYCMKARGALQRTATTTTDKLGGRFFTNPTLRQEFFDAIRGS